jgi:ATP-dependent Lon protease
VREKVLAAHRLGIKRVLLPERNAKDLVDVPEDLRNQLEFVFCDRIEQVLDNALVKQGDVQHHSADWDGCQQRSHLKT